jgi:hypothetical protein
MVATRLDHSTLFNCGSQQVQVAFDAGALVADAGLLLVRQLERSLGFLDDLAQRLPDPRSPKFIHHCKRTLLTQQVYQILAGYPDCNDAQAYRTDPLFQILADIAPDPEQPLACGSTLARFQYAYTRRQAIEPGEPEILLQQRAAQLARVKIVNTFFVDWFIRTRPTPPAEIIIDLDPTDDPVHGQQALSGYHGYYQQHQYLPLVLFEGTSGFPLACWLRPGTMHAACGAIDVLKKLVERLRRAWPEVDVRVRGDSGYSVPGLLDYCEEAKLGYAFGYASNAVLQRRSEHWLAEVELVHRFYGYRDPHMQRYEQITDYQAQSWPRPRRVVVKIEATPQGSQRRYVVTNLCEPERQLYRDFYVQRGGVPEQPIGELKNGLRADRLSSGGFCANALKLLVAVVAYALVVLYREACAGVEGVANADAQALRKRLWKVPAEVRWQTEAVRVSLPGGWEGRLIWEQTVQAARRHAWQLQQVGQPPGVAQQAP